MSDIDHETQNAVRHIALCRLLIPKEVDESARYAISELVEIRRQLAPARTDSVSGAEASRAVPPSGREIIFQKARGSTCEEETAIVQRGGHNKASRLFKSTNPYSPSRKINESKCRFVAAKIPQIEHSAWSQALREDDESENQRAHVPGLRWHRVSKGKATGAVRPETLSGPVQDMRWKRENYGRCRLSGVTRTGKRLSVRRSALNSWATELLALCPISDMIVWLITAPISASIGD
jgi:hypothetical protein